MKRMTLTLPLALVLLAGCRSLAPDGVYQGDKFVYNAELGIVTAQDLLHTYVKWEYQNRAALASTPAIKQSADAVRANGKKWIQSAINLTEAYKANPTTENKDALVKALAILRAAMTEASSYMIRTTGN